MWLLFVMLMCCVGLFLCIWLVVSWLLSGGLLVMVIL